MASWRHGSVVVELTELVAFQEAEPPRPGVVGLEAGVRHAPAFLAADPELRRAGRRDHQREAGEPQAQRSRHGWLERRGAGTPPLGTCSVR